MYTMNSQKLSQYSAFALSIILCKDSDAQVLYSDINPDVWWQWEYNGFEFPIDVDQDGQMDFRFFTCASATEGYSCSGFAGAFFISAYRSNLVGSAILPIPTPSEIECICSDICDSFYNQTMGVKPVLLNDTISIHDNWGAAYLIYAENVCGFPSPHYGLLTRTDEYDYFIPLQINDYGTHLGWVRLNHKASVAEKKIFDMGYQIQLGQPIVAGDTSNIISGEEQLEGEEFAHLYYHANTLYITFQEYTDCKINVFDMQGNKLFSDFTGYKYYSTPLNLPTGIYVVKLELELSVLTKRLFIY